MTRFARAKGSKASNERLPEEATSWTVMKQQLFEKNKDIEDNKKRQEIMDKRNANYKAFLQEKEETESKNSEWANFPGVDQRKSNTKENYSKIISKPTEMNQYSSDDETFQILKSRVDKALETNKLISQNDTDSDGPPDEKSAKHEIIVPHSKVKKSKKKKIKIESLEVGLKNSENKDIKPLVKAEINVDSENQVQRKRRKSEQNDVLEKRIKLSKKIEGSNKDSKINGAKQKKSGMKPKKAVKDNPTPKDLKNIERKKQKRIRQLEKKKRLKAEQKQQKELEETQNENHGKSTTIGEDVGNVTNHPINKEISKIKSQNPLPKQPNRIEKLKSKNRDKEEHPRKKPLLPQKMFINGKELEIDYVDGFPVKKEDALRLKKLRREMISKGLPRSEINQSLKLERRKAEKAFAREKKKVCFNCRTSGHNLSECPELGKNQVVQTAGSGICFKCGSTEHTHFECKVVRGQEFKFAQCFICQEQGHIARQCPDNARGLYPKGGACNVCGDVTHLKRDCPKHQAQQQHLENSLRIETVGASNPDVLETKSENTLITMSKKQNKIIKF